MNRLAKHFHRNPSERKLWEKVARRFILPPHGPRALRMGSWAEREARLKRVMPIRFFFWDTVPDAYKSVVRRFSAIKWWVRYRTVDRYDIVKLEINKGYHEPEERILYANFQILKDFVEIELASMWDAGKRDDSEDVSIYLRMVGKLTRRNRSKNLRQPQMGLDHLDWEIKEAGGHQGASAAEKKELYLWWTEGRLNRLESYGEFFDVLESYTDSDSSLPMSLGKTTAMSYNYQLQGVRTRLEEFHQMEDEEMLTRLVKIRQSLWT